MLVSLKGTMVSETTTPVMDRLRCRRATLPSISRIYPKQAGSVCPWYVRRTFCVRMRSLGVLVEIPLSTQFFSFVGNSENPKAVIQGSTIEFSDLARGGVPLMRKVRIKLNESPALHDRHSTGNDTTVLVPELVSMSSVPPSCATKPSISLLPIPVRWSGV